MSITKSPLFSCGVFWCKVIVTERLWSGRGGAGGTKWLHLCVIRTEGTDLFNCSVERETVEAWAGGSGERHLAGKAKPSRAVISGSGCLSCAS